MGEWVEVAGLDEIGDGGLHAMVGEDEVLLVRCKNKVFAVGYLCSHQDMELEGGHCEADGWVCPHHGARFDLKSGKALSMPAVEGIPTYPVKVEGGRVFIRESQP
jgi:3-phenylpropionate/trans-cinnamate dioxygenase ferredoxin subunit